MIQYNFDSLFQRMDLYHKEIIDKLEFALKQFRASNKEVCRIQCKTAQGHKENLRRAIARAKTIKESGPKNPLDKYLITLLD